MDVEKSQRVPHFSFFGIVRLFSQKCFSPKGPPSFFWCFATMGVKKCERVAPIRSNFFGFFRYRRREKRILWHFEVLLLFFSLRYGADLGRSQLVKIVSSPMIGEYVDIGDVGFEDVSVISDTLGHVYFVGGLFEHRRGVCIVHTHGEGDSTCLGTSICALVCDFHEKLVVVHA